MSVLLNLILTKQGCDHASFEPDRLRSNLVTSISPSFSYPYCCWNFFLAILRTCSKWGTIAVLYPQSIEELYFMGIIFDHDPSQPKHMFVHFNQSS